VDVQHKLDAIRRKVEAARTMPMSASCMINRNQLLADLADVQRLLPGEFAEARSVVEHRQTAVAEARAEAARVMEEAWRERRRLVYETDVYREAKQYADELVAQARQEAEGLRREVDDYVDQKLASFEIALHKTLNSVVHGRDQLRTGGPPAGRHGEVPLSPRETDDYVEHKLGRFEHSLHKTLDAVTRGRERLRDRSGLDTFAADEDAPPLPGWGPNRR
jgi:vacuolar-type H+-ATPase subunit H